MDKELLFKLYQDTISEIETYMKTSFKNARTQREAIKFANVGASNLYNKIKEYLNGNKEF